MVGADHGARPGGFARRVDVVRAGRGAGGEDRGAVEVVGADCVDYEVGGCAEAGEGGGGEIEGFDVWLFAVWVESFEGDEEVEEFAFGSACNSPAKVGGERGGDVFGAELSGVASCSKEDEVIFLILFNGSHGGMLFGVEYGDEKEKEDRDLF